MANTITLDDLNVVISKLTNDGYDIEIHVQDRSILLKTFTDNIQVNRRVSLDFTLRELAFVFWDISNTLKRMERKVGKRLDRKSG